MRPWQNKRDAVLTARHVVDKRDIVTARGTGESIGVFTDTGRVEDSRRRDLPGAKICHRRFGQKRVIAADALEDITARFTGLQLPSVSHLHEPAAVVALIGNVTERPDHGRGERLGIAAESGEQKIAVTVDRVGQLLHLVDALADFGGNLCAVLGGEAGIVGLHSQFANPLQSHVHILQHGILRSEVGAREHDVFLKLVGARDSLLNFQTACRDKRIIGRPQLRAPRTDLLHQVVDIRLALLNLLDTLLKQLSSR